MASGWYRRRFLSFLLAGCGFAVAAPAATPEGEAAMRRVLGSASVRPGRVKVDLPPLIENGNSAPLTVTVDSPMDARDRVKAIHVFAEKNPVPHVASFHFGRHAGAAKVATRIRLAHTQTVTAVAEMADGGLWSGEIQVVVTVAACVEGL